jgi:hypothetical protein
MWRQRGYKITRTTYTPALLNFAALATALEKYGRRRQEGKQIRISDMDRLDHN